ncbi:S-adenosyl-L-methionine-dependent methyltransferase [Mycena galericulata]|nr:S-adenosyl-L-methionine-dependent methyltransferase [Mycena galericulata]
MRRASPQMSHLSALVQLSNLISESVATLQRISSETGTTVPDLDAPADSAGPEVFSATPAAANAARIIAAAGLQLAALTMRPHEVVLEVIHGGDKAAALRVCVEANVTEILREAGPQGAHARDIAAKAGIDGLKLARVMRHLATHHIYREVAPDTFANNRLSAVLDSGKPVTELFASPEIKHVNTDGFPALASFKLGVGSRAACHLWEAMSDPATRYSDNVVDSAFHRSLGIKIPVWQFWEQPEQTKNRNLFGIAMKGFGTTHPPETTLEAFPWADLPKDAVVVDVGGGVGWATLPLAKKYPHLRIVVQDQVEVVNDGLKIWNNELPEAIKSKQVSFRAHNFFAPQPVLDASVFFLRYIIHDWMDPEARTILTHLREAAAPNTVLVILDHIIPYACRSSTDTDSSAGLADAPLPLLPNYGGANSTGYLLDLTMLVNLNAQERKLGDVERLLQSSGWKLQRVFPIEITSGFFQPIHAVPGP